MSKVPLKRQAEAYLPTEWGKFRMFAYARRSDDRLALLDVYHGQLRVGSGGHGDAVFSVTAHKDERDSRGSIRICDDAVHIDAVFGKPGDGLLAE